MELKVFWRTLRRRWYLTMVLFVLTVGATAYVVVDVGPDYEAEGSALVFPPASSTRSEGTTQTVGNPYLELGGVTQARDVVIRALTSRSVRDDWSDAFPGMDYDVTPDFTNSAPIILFTVEGGTPTGASAALDELMSRVPTILVDLQDGLGLPQDGYVTARKLTQDSRPSIVRKSQIRSGLLVAGVIGGMGLLLLALIDSLLVRLARGRAERRADAAEREARGEAEEDEEDEEAEEAEEDEEDEEAEEAEEAEEDEEDEPADEPEEEELDEHDLEPAYTYRVPVDSDLAVSPARSSWLRSATTSTPRTGSRFRDRTASSDLVGVSATRAVHHGATSAVATASRSKAPGRNR